MVKPNSKKTKSPSTQSKLATSPDLDQNTYPKWWITLVVVTAAVFSYINSEHLANLFENDRHFSHLADFEREMAFRTEMGLYFSYYKTIINAPSYTAGLYEITHDNVTEHGHMINTLKRFNLYPEVFLSFTYRIFKSVAAQMDWRVENCWQINRGDGLAPVQGCEGIGNSHYFYTTHVFALAGTVAGTLFVLGVLVSHSFVGGLLAVAAFFFNHGEATRVQWTPPLRESFGFPFILAQIAVVTYILKNARHGYGWSLLMSLFTVSALLCWQFSQFAFFTQLGSLFVIYALDFVPSNTMKTLANGHLLSFVISFIMLFGNEMLLTAFYFPTVMALMLILFLEPLFDRILLRPAFLLLSSIVFVGSAVGLKLIISKSLQVEDDAHIIDILKSKFSDYANFHTRLYTCSTEFDFMQWETVMKLCYTVLIPTTVAAFLLFTVYILLTENKNILWRASSKGKQHAEVFYNIVQLLCYTVMAVLIMRLKLFFTPHLCVVAAIIANHKLIMDCFRTISINKTVHVGVLVALLAAMAYQGKANVEKQLSVRGEYSNPEQEMLFDWITKNTAPDAVFAGTMPVMANVKLSTGRPIVNHPHYEDVGIRERTLKVYSMFSKKPLDEVHRTLTEMGVNYFIFQLFNCAPDKNRPFCAYRGMWDEQDPANINRTSNCDLYHKSIHSKQPKLILPFQIVYNYRNNYLVVKV